VLAEMLGVRSEQIAFMRNTSDGFATIANGLDWKDSDNIVTFAHEFPANFYAWRRIRDKFGVELRLCPEKDGGIDLDEFIELIDENTKIVSISAIQFSSGFRADLERIGKTARDFDALFAVDIIQALGTTPFDLPSQYVDIASGAGHKWLCSPEGCGMLYLSDRAIERIEPTLVGWISVDDPWNFNDYEQDFKPNALAWETGTGTASLFYGMEQSLKILNTVGAEKIKNYLEELTDFLCESVPSKRYEIVSSRKKGEKSQIVCLRSANGPTSEEICRKLESQKIIVSARGERIRISPHFYNSQKDIETLVENLP
jgi:selenocysteine lyase/cysteine desulfurase